MNHAFRCMLFSLALLVVFCQAAYAGNPTIRIGFNIPLTGMFEVVGGHSKNAAELIRKDIVSQGGLKVGNQTYDVVFLYGDNESNASAASTLTINQITKDQVIGIVGPLSSRQAIPVGQMSNSFSTPMISPWSTSPITTQDKPFVFRSCFINTIQGPLLTKFTAKEFNATRAAVLYDILNPYSRGLAKAFRESYEAVNGPDSVVAFENFRTDDSDFSTQLERIRQSGAQFIFTPQHFNEVPLIVKQVKSLRLNIPVIGSNSWAGGDIIGECGSDCEGLFFSGNYAPGGATGINKKFIAAYKSEYGSSPDEPAALTWDAVRVLIQAIKDTGGLTENLLENRIAVRNALVNIKNFDGASGMMSFNESGTPSKCAVIVKIEDGELNFHESVCP